MSEIVHVIKHIVGFCGEYSHPSILISSGIFITTAGLYWSKFISYVKDLF